MVIGLGVLSVEGESVIDQNEFWSVDEIDVL